MLQTKKISADKVAVAYSPTEIMIRKSGKQYFGKEVQLAWLDGDRLIIDEDVAREFGIKITTTCQAKAVIKKGDHLWFVDYEEGEIEETVVHSAYYVDGHIVSFSVNFMESNDFDEFVGKAIGDNFFMSEELAMQALTNGHGIKG